MKEAYVCRLHCFYLTSWKCNDPVMVRLAYIDIILNVQTKTRPLIKHTVFITSEIHYYKCLFLIT